MTVQSRARTLILGLLISLVPILPAQAASTDPGGARAHVETLGREALASLQAPHLSPADRESMLAGILQRGVAVDQIGRFALGRHWRRATPAERNLYTDLFRDFVVKTYAGYLNGLAGTSLEVVQTVPVGERDVLVTTQIDRPAAEAVEIGWRVRTIDGSYKVIDVVVEGVSLATAQRQDFNAVVGRRGVVGLLDSLRAKTRTVTALR